jgi:hypothetical protein
VVEPELSLASWRDAERLFRGAREALVPVRQPLVLVSQVQRSGGTLVNTLLDGHPELHSHPYELHIGQPTKYDWPSLDLKADSDQWIDALREPIIELLFRTGYRKKPHMFEMEDYPVLPFGLVPSFLERLFRLQCMEDPPQTQREVLDRYFTAFFNAWVDCQGLRERPKKWVAAFVPRIAWGESRSRFFADYPDGRLVSIHRDPRAWYASAHRFSSRYGTLDEAIELWLHGAREIVSAKEENPGRVFVLTYETLVTKPNDTVRRLAEWLGITWNPILLEPTFNRMATLANTSFEMAEEGVRTESLRRWRDLPKDAITKIEQLAMDQDGRVRAIADVA